MHEENIGDVWESLNSIDRSELMGRFVRELPFISGEMGITPGEVAARTGMDASRVKLIINGRRKMKWSEYMSMLFVLWDDENGRRIIDERGFFPQELKNAMKAGRKAGI